MRIEVQKTLVVLALGCLFSIAAHAAGSTVKVPSGATVKIDGNSAMVSGGGGGGQGINDGHYVCSCSEEGTCTLTQAPSSISCNKGTNGTCKADCKLITSTTGVVGPAAISAPGTSKGGAGMKAPVPAGKK